MVVATVFDAFDYLTDERIGNGSDHYADGLGLLRDQAPGYSTCSIAGFPAMR